MYTINYNPSDFLHHYVNYKLNANKFFLVNDLSSIKNVDRSAKNIALSVPNSTLKKLSEIRVCVLTF